MSISSLCPSFFDSPLIPSSFRNMSTAIARSPSRMLSAGGIIGVAADSVADHRFPHERPGRTPPEPQMLIAVGKKKGTGPLQSSEPRGLSPFFRPHQSGVTPEYENPGFLADKKSEKNRRN